MRRFVALALLVACGCAEPAPPVRKPRPTRPPGRDQGPNRVVMDQILISFEGSRNARSRRTKEEAKELAYALLQKIRLGVKFADLKQELSDDRAANGRANGPYEITNYGIPHVVPELPRKNWAEAVANLAFAIEPGDVGVADYHPRRCPFGYHVVARIR